MGFRSSCDLLALTMFGYTLFFFLFNGQSDIFQSASDLRDTSVDEKEEFDVLKEDDDYERVCDEG